MIDRKVDRKVLWLQVWHEGDSDRLVLIIDLWHPDLRNSEQRAAAIRDPNLRARFEKIVQSGELFLGENRSYV